jgi:hypothetical protein
MHGEYAPPNQGISIEEFKKPLKQIYFNPKLKNRLKRPINLHGDLVPDLNPIIKDH